MNENYTLDRPSALSCPECGGAMSREDVGTLLQYRCHIGHAFTAETMLEAQSAALESTLGASLRALNERAELCRQMAERLPEANRDRQLLASAANQALERAVLVKELLEADWVQPEQHQVPAGDQLRR